MKSLLILLAVIDARRKSAADMQHVRDIDIAMRRSSDNGETWSKPKDIRDDIMPASVKERDFVFITSGWGIQTRSGALIHTICHVGKGGYFL